MWVECVVAVTLVSTQQFAGEPARMAVPSQAKVLAQQAGWAPGGWGAGFGPRPFGAGMAAPRWGGGSGPRVWGGTANDDHGPVLVDLIQKTVAPRHWAPHGGPGTIHYWRPGRALVIRASDEVHGQIGDVLRQLQRAGQ